MWRTQYIFGLVLCTGHSAWTFPQYYWRTHASCQQVGCVFSPKERAQQCVKLVLWSRGASSFHATNEVSPNFYVEFDDFVSRIGCSALPWTLGPRSCKSGWDMAYVGKAPFSQMGHVFEWELLSISHHNCFCGCCGTSDLEEYQQTLVHWPPRTAQ